jgi:excisionase family DNA binding protein
MVSSRSLKKEQANMQGTLTRVEAAKYLSISERYLDKLIASGEIRRVKLGAKTVLPVAELERFIESKLEAATAK